MSIYNSHSHMHGFVLAHGKHLKPHDIAFVVIALVLPTDTQRAAREQRLFASSMKGGSGISYVPNHLDNSSFTFSAHHKTLLGKDSEGHVQSYRPEQKSENVNHTGNQIRV